WRLTLSGKRATENQSTSVFSSSPKNGSASSATDRRIEVSIKRHSSPLSKVVGPTIPTPKSASTLASKPTSSLTSRTAVCATSSPGSQIPVTGAQFPLSARRASSTLG